MDEDETLREALRLAVDPPGGVSVEALQELARDDQAADWDIATTAGHLGVNPHTLRYYERIGLIPPVPRTKSGIRDYDQTSCSWIEFIKCMRAAGLQIEALIEYVALFQQGDSTIGARKALLLEQRDQLEERIATMQQTLERLNHKIENYGNCLAKEPELRGKAKD